jgi:hypothetical protein
MATFDTPSVTECKVPDRPMDTPLVFNGGKVIIERAPTVKHSDLQFR